MRLGNFPNSSNRDVAVRGSKPSLFREVSAGRSIAPGRGYTPSAPPFPSAAPRRYKEGSESDQASRVARVLVLLVLRHFAFLVTRPRRSTLPTSVVVTSSVTSEVSRSFFRPTICDHKSVPGHPAGCRSDHLHISSLLLHQRTMSRRVPPDPDGLLMVLLRVQTPSKRLPGVGVGACVYRLLADLRKPGQRRTNIPSGGLCRLYFLSTSAATIMLRGALFGGRGEWPHATSRRSRTGRRLTFHGAAAA